MIEKTLAFVLGVSIALLVWGVMVVFKTVGKVKEIEKAIERLEDWIIRNDEMVNRRIDQEIDRTNQQHSDSISYTDSRVDKLEARLTTSPKEVLKG